MASTHITPNDDLDDHYFSSECPCKPVVSVMSNGVFLVVHSAFDGRHLVEQAIEGLPIEINESAGWSVFQLE